MRKAKGNGARSGLLPNSLRIISSCLKTVSSSANTVVRSAGATVASSTAVAAEDEKDQVLWAGFDKLVLHPSTFRCVLLLGYSNGFQVVDVDGASSFSELVSKRDGPVTFLQMQPPPEKSESHQGFRESHLVVLAVATDATNCSQDSHSNDSDSAIDAQSGNSRLTPTVIRFYSLSSDCYVHVLRFRSTVYLIRCCPRIIAVALASQIYCFDAVTLENKFSVLTYPLPQGGQGRGLNIGCGPMALGSRWLAYASSNPLMPNTGRLSPQTPSPGVSPSSSPGSGSVMARYAIESSKQLAAGIINLGDLGYKTLSKYCQELLPDGSSSPVSPNSSMRMGRGTSVMDAENAGMVVVKDFVSMAVISQFRAHTSPICALCFDPSGTLLVTASVHGHNINIFQILPTCMQNGSPSLTHDWATAHRHLYKLYRGLTTAVIQDICFSHHSQWVAIVSSRGTCHIFVLAPFSGDIILGPQKVCDENPMLLSNLPPPSWSNSIIHQLSSLHPPITLSVVSRIKNCSAGWFGALSSAAASATGSAPVPSGALAATFHNSDHQNLKSIHLRGKSLEHLLVYSPSGHVVQYDLLPSAEVESCENNSRTGLSRLPEEELCINAVPFQYWNVCRRFSWPERDGGLSGISLRHPNSVAASGLSGSDDSGKKHSHSFGDFVEKDLVKPCEKNYWYLSNAEVNICMGRVPIWQKPKIYFHALLLEKAAWAMPSDDYSGGEIEIEHIPVHEIEIKQKDLLPVFEHINYTTFGWNNRVQYTGKSPSSSSVIDQAKDTSTDASFSHEGLGSPSCSSLGILDVGSSIVEMHTHSEMSHGSIISKHIVNNLDVEKNEPSLNVLNSLPKTGNGMVGSGLSSIETQLDPVGGSSRSTCSSYEINSKALNACSSEIDNFSELLEGGTDGDSSCSHCEREKHEEDGDSDGILGGEFSFCE